MERFQHINFLITKTTKGSLSHPSTISISTGITTKTEQKHRIMPILQRQWNAPKKAYLKQR